MKILATRYNFILVWKLSEKALKEFKVDVDKAARVPIFNQFGVDFF